VPPPSLRLKDLAAHLGREVEGDGDVEIGGAAALESAGPGDLSFVRSERYADRLAASRAGAVIAPPGVAVGDRPALRSDAPGLDFSRAVRLILPETSPPPGIHVTAAVAAGARVDALASVGPHCSVAAGASIGPRSVLYAGVSVYDRVAIGADCRIHSGCVLREDVVVGERVILHPGVVLGGDGFGYVGDGAGGLAKVPQVGGVVVGDDVEIGAGTTVDRGTLEDTRIGRGSKIDNLVQIGHNCIIGEQVIIVAQVGLAGSTIVERGAVIMGQAGAAGHLTIGEGAVVGPQSGLHKDVPPGVRVLGSPQREEHGFHRAMAALAKLRSSAGWDCARRPGSASARDGPLARTPRAPAGARSRAPPGRRAQRAAGRAASGSPPRGPRSRAAHGTPALCRGSRSGAHGAAIRAPPALVRERRPPGRRRRRGRDGAAGGTGGGGGA
jgi:UDP-3-O-[3-hydroxymyristoyl] glucosamine N-acyltransferase